MTRPTFGAADALNSSLVRGDRPSGDSVQPSKAGADAMAPGGLGERFNLSALVRRAGIIPAMAPQALSPTPALALRPTRAISGRANPASRGVFLLAVLLLSACGPDAPPVERTFCVTRGSEEYRFVGDSFYSLSGFCVRFFKIGRWDSTPTGMICGEDLIVTVCDAGATP